MLDDITTSEDRGGTIFESFSDIALCTLVVALLLVTLLAINITQNLNVKINRNTFSGGVMRPSLHLECTTPDFAATTDEALATERALFSGAPYVAVHLFSPSLAMIATDVQGGGTVALGEDQTFAQQQDLSLYQFMRLAAGIDPGSFDVEGSKTALLLPSILDKQMVYEPSTANGYRANADRRLTKRLLSSLWPVYGNPTYPARRPEDYSHARTRLFVESKTVALPDGGEEHHVVIGHVVYKVPDAFEDGSLAWLGGFSSGLTEIIYLGETWSDAEQRTNKRIEFFERTGHADCAEAYREYAFPSADAPGQGALAETLGTMGYPPARAGQVARDAVFQQQASAALLEGRLADNEGGFLPPLVAYPGAWAAYIEDGRAQSIEPPRWFYNDFLDKLGFDRMTIERSVP